MRTIYDNWIKSYTVRVHDWIKSYTFRVERYRLSALTRIADAADEYVRAHVNDLLADEHPSSSALVEDLLECDYYYALSEDN
jgi:hypothetical protein